MNVRGREPNTDSLFHQQVGESGSLVIGLHGLATTNRLLSRRLAPLGDRARLYFPDLLGHGQSPWPDCAYDRRQHLDALQDWREAHGLADEPVVLVGVSLGAILALSYAAHEMSWYGSSSVRGVVAISTLAYPDLATARAVVARTSAMAYLMVHRPRIAARLCRFLCGVGGRGWTYGPRFARWLPRNIVEDTFAHCWQSLSGTFEEIVLRPGLAELLPRLESTPLLFLHGERDRLAPLRYLEAALDGRAGQSLVILRGADHNAIATRTTEIVGALRGFLEQLDNSVVSASPRGRGSD